MIFAPIWPRISRAAMPTICRVLDEADAYVARNGLDLPEEPEARRIEPDPAMRDQSHSRAERG